MKLNIDKDSTYEQLRDEFAKAYPYLKIEFYAKKHAEREVSLDRQRTSQKGLISVVVNGQVKTIDISGNRTVSQFEEDVQEVLGLGVQVFRKSGNLWIETTLTDRWTLLQQNHEGRLMSAPIAEDEKPDYHEKD